MYIYKLSKTIPQLTDIPTVFFLQDHQNEYRVNFIFVLLDFVNRPLLGGVLHHRQFIRY